MPVTEITDLSAPRWRLLNALHTTSPSNPTPMKDLFWAQNADPEDLRWLVAQDLVAGRNAWDDPLLADRVALYTNHTVWLTPAGRTLVRDHPRNRVLLALREHPRRLRLHHLTQQVALDVLREMEAAELISFHRPDNEHQVLLMEHRDPDPELLARMTSRGRARMAF